MTYYGAAAHTDSGTSGDPARVELDNGNPPDPTPPVHVSESHLDKIRECSEIINLCWFIIQLNDKNIHIT